MVDRDPYILQKKDSSFTDWPKYGQEEKNCVLEILDSARVNYWGGTHCKEFEREFAESIGVDYAISLSNGSIALELALRTLGVGVGDEVVVTARSFIATASCVVLVGAKPVFADIDLNSQNLTARTIKDVITPGTKAIICVHLAGWPCEMDEIVSLANQYKIPVVEDCAQAHGAEYKGRKVGAIGDVAAWSFCQDKVMSTVGEGGMVTTNNKALYEFARAFKDHGKNIEKIRSRVNSQVSNHGFNWVHDSIGSNYRMTEIQAAIGRLQLKKLPFWRSKRLSNATRIWQAASDFPVFRVPSMPEYIVHAGYKCSVFIEPSQLKSGWGRDKILEKINDLGVPCTHGSCPEIYLEKAFDGMSIRPENRLPNAKYLGETSLQFLIHPTLSREDLELTIQVIKHVGALASLKNNVQTLVPM